MFVPFMAALTRCLVNLFTTGGFRQCKTLPRKNSLANLIKWVTYFPLFCLALAEVMSDNASLTEQTTCVDSESEDAWYIIDIFSHVQLELDEGNEYHKQLFLYVTRAGGNRRTFLQVHNFLRDLGWDNVAEFAPLLLSTSWVGYNVLSPS